MPVNDFKVFATDVSAVVDDQATFEANTTVLNNGVQPGFAAPETFNKIFRQSSIIGSMIGDFINDETGEDSLDDGTITTLLSNFKLGVIAALGGGVGGTVLSYSEIDHTDYFDINSSSWLDVTNFTDNIVVTNAPVLLDIEAYFRVWYSSGGQAAYFRLVLNGGEYTDEIIDYDSSEGYSSSNISHNNVLSSLITLAQNTTYTVKLQARNSAASPTQDSRINASEDFPTSADPDTKGKMTIIIYKG